MNDFVNNIILDNCLQCSKLGKLRSVSIIHAQEVSPTSAFIQACWCLFWCKVTIRGWVF